MYDFAQNGVNDLKKWICLVLLCSMVLGLCGCKGDQGDHVINIQGDTVPHNLDPLLASTQSEKTVMENLYESLFTIDDAGQVLPGAAEKYEFSADGKTCTVTLQDDLTWSNGEDITPADFVFALQRAVDPITKASCGNLLTCIAGATEILAGKQQPATLGVTPLEDGLVFQVVGRKESLLSALASPAGMPCNQAFFEECKGRYGTGAKYLLTNGPFQMKGWSTEEPDIYVRLIRSEEYRNKKEVCPSGIYFTFGKATDGLSLVKEGKLDGTLITGDLVDSAKGAGLQLLSHYSQTYGLIFNTKGQTIMQNANLRKAMAGAIDRGTMAGYLPASYEKTELVVLPKTYYGTAPYPAANPSVVSLWQNRKEYLNNAVKELDAEALQSMELWYVDGSQTRSAIDYIVQCWQKELGIYVTVKEVTQTELWYGLANGYCHIGLGVLSGQGTGALETMQSFAFAGDASSNGYTDATFDQLLTTASGGELTALQQCEAHLLNNGYLVPLYSSKCFYAFGKNITNVTIRQYTQTLQLEKGGKIQ